MTTYLPLSLKAAAVKNVREPIGHLAGTFNFSQVMDMIRHKIVNEEIIAPYADRLNWRFILQTAPVSEKILEKFASHIYWDDILEYQDLSPDFVKRHQDLVKPNLLFKRLQLSWHEDDFDWFMDTFPHSSSKIFETQTHITEQFIMRRIKEGRHFSWSNLNRYNLIRARRPWSTNFLRTLIRKFDLIRLFKFTILTEAQIEMFMPRHDPRRPQEFVILLTEDQIEMRVSQHDMNRILEAISSHQILSLEFIDRHRASLKWERIAAKQILNDDMIRMIQERQDWTEEEKTAFSSELTDFTRIDTFPHLCDWHIISERSDITEEFIHDHANKIIFLSVNIPLPSDLFLDMYHERFHPSYVTMHASEQFLTKHPHFLTQDLRENKRLISMNFLHEHFDLIGAENLKRDFYLTNRFMDINRDRL